MPRYAVRVDEAQQRLLERVIAFRRTALADDAREAIVAVWPLLPSLIEEKLGAADARIFSREDLRALLAEFAVDVLLEQVQAIDRWSGTKARKRRRKGG
jgi:hypothetical protein